MFSAYAKSVFSDLGIRLEPPAPKESWAHGYVQEFKTVASKVQLSFPVLAPETVIALTTHSLNATENVHGFTPHQWVYGKQ